MRETEINANSEGESLDLRASQKGQELGRNPRGESAPVSETILKYKKTQARKFAEHGSDNRRGDIRETVTDADLGGLRKTESDNRSAVRAEDGKPLNSPLITPENKPTINKLTEARAVPLHMEQPVSSSVGRTGKQNKRGSDARLRFGKEQGDKRDISVTADKTTTPADATSPVVSSDLPTWVSFTKAEQALPDNSLLKSETPESDSVLSHQRESQLTHNRDSALRHNRSQKAETPPKRSKSNYAKSAVFMLKNAKHPQNEAVDLPKPVTENNADWRRADDTSPKQEDAPVSVDSETRREPGKRTDTDRSSDITNPLPEADSEREATTEGLADGTGSSAVDDSPLSSENFINPADASAVSAANPVSDGDSAPADTVIPANEPILKNELQPTEKTSKLSPKKLGSEPRGDGGGKKKKSKLNFENAADTPVGKKSGRKLDKALDKAERSAEKLEKAKGKIPTKSKLRTGGEFDAEKGKLKPRLRFEKEVKTQAEHLKGAPITRPIKLGAGAAVNFAHNKMFQAENDNVAVKAAHRGELIAERGARSAYRYVKNTPYRRVQKLQGRTENLNMKADYRRALHDNPNLKGKPLAQMMQKRRIKKQYAKAAWDAQKAGKAVTKVTAKTAIKLKSFAVTAGKKILAMIANPKVLIIGGILALIIIIILGAVSACSSMFSGIGSSVTGMSYLSKEDSDIDDAELYYTELETDLQILIENTEIDNPGYDEYRYNIGNIGHDPYMLIAFLTAVYQDFTFNDVKSVLDSLFAEQYQLTFTPSVETKYRDDGEGGLEPYDWKVMTVTLTSQSLLSVITPHMDFEQMEHYYLLMQSKGLRQYAASPFAFNWLPFVSSNYGYRIHPITGVKDYHLGIDIALPTGTEILAAHTGEVTFAEELGGYGLVVVIEDSDGLVTKYAHCDALFVSAGQTVTVGHVIAAVGSTGDSTGPHLHFEVIRNGRYLNPLFFSFTSNN